MATFHFDPNTDLLRFTVLVSEGEALALEVALDSGAVLTVIPVDAARGLGLDPDHAPCRVTLTTASGLASAPIVVLPRMVALGQMVEDLEVLCHDLPSGTGVDGLVGLNFLRRFLILINFPKGILVIQPPPKNLWQRSTAGWEVLQATVFA